MDVVTGVPRSPRFEVQRSDPSRYDVPHRCYAKRALLGNDK